MAGLGSLSPGRTVIVSPRARRNNLVRAGWTRRQTQQWLYDHAWRSLAELKRGARWSQPSTTNPALVDWLYGDSPHNRPSPLPGPADAGRVLAGDEGVRVHRGLGPDDISLTVGGGDAGGHSAFFPRGAAALRSFVTKGGAGMMRILDPTLRQEATPVALPRAARPRRLSGATSDCCQ